MATITSVVEQRKSVDLPHYVRFIIVELNNGLKFGQAAQTAYAMGDFDSRAANCAKARRAYEAARRLLSRINGGTEDEGEWIEQAVVELDAIICCLSKRQ